MKHALASLFAVVMMVPVANADTRQADPPLVVNGDLSLTTSDFTAYLERVPAGRRDEFRAEFKRIDPTVDGLWIRRVLAQKAREAGLDKDPVVQIRLRQAQEDVLYQVYLANVAKSAPIPPNLEQRAREIYKVRQKDFMMPELVKVQHILVGLTGRSRDDALARARKIHDEAVAGKKDFLALAAEYSDEPNKNRVGEAPAMPPSSFEKPIPDALAKLKDGDISPPIESKFGFHVFKLVGRQHARVRPYEEVRESIIAQEKQQIADDAVTAAVEGVRGDPKTHLYLENVEALRSQLSVPDEHDPKVIRNYR